MNTLSPVEQDIYRFISNNLDKLPYMRVREVAYEADVSTTSVFRFVQKIGYESYIEFKYHAKQFVTDSSKESMHQIQPFTLKQRIDMFDMNLFHPDIEYQLQRCAEEITKADFILFIGLGASSSIAQYAARKMANLGFFCLNLEELTYPIHSLLQNKNNLLIFLSVSGETSELIEIIRGIKKGYNLKKYCITQNKDSTLARCCDYSIEYKIQEDRKNVFLDLTSQIPAVLIIETLVSYLQ